MTADLGFQAEGANVLVNLPRLCVVFFVGHAMAIGPERWNTQKPANNFDFRISYQGRSNANHLKFHTIVMVG